MSKFIVIEGLEGAGKSSAVRYVTDYLHGHGVARIECTREPGGTPLAERMRAIVKEVHDERLTIEAELLLMYASRVQLVETRIKPALADGVWVVGDRHDLSSQAYQGGGRGIDANLIGAIKRAVLGDFKPDLTLYLDIDPPSACSGPATEVSWTGSSSSNSASSNVPASAIWNWLPPMSQSR